MVRTGEWDRAIEVCRAVLDAGDAPATARMVAAAELGFVYVLRGETKRARRLLEPQPTVLIHNGRVLEEHLRRERITVDELHAALRRSGVIDPEKVRLAVLEENGQISVIPRTGESKDKGVHLAG